MIGILPTGIFANRQQINPFGAERLLLSAEYEQNGKNGDR
jgi:hypothetical protein